MCGKQGKHLAGACSRVHPAGLEHDPHPGTQGGRVAAGVEAEYPDAAGIRLPETLADLDRGRLPRAVRAEQSGHRTR